MRLLLFRSKEVATRYQHNKAFYAVSISIDLIKGESDEISTIIICLLPVLTPPLFYLQLLFISLSKSLLYFSRRGETSVGGVYRPVKYSTI